MDILYIITFILIGSFIIYKITKPKPVEKTKPKKAPIKKTVVKPSVTDNTSQKYLLVGGTEITKFSYTLNSKKKSIVTIKPGGKNVIQTADNTPIVVSGDGQVLDL